MASWLSEETARARRESQENDEEAIEYDEVDLSIAARIIPSNSTSWRLSGSVTGLGSPLSTERGSTTRSNYPVTQLSFQARFYLLLSENIEHKSLLCSFFRKKEVRVLDYLCGNVEKVIPKES